MAKVNKNIVMQGLSGSLGDQVVLKQDKAGRTIVSTKPAFNSKREFSDEQKAHQANFKEAAAYARMAARTEPIYALKAEGKAQSAYNVAMADWFNKPEIDEVNLSGWSGQAGGTIRVKALDDVKVKQVTVVITNEQDVEVERGTAAANGELWWEYTTTASVTGQPKVTVEVMDLPGNIAQAMRQRQN